MWVHPRPVRLGFTLLSHSVRMDEDRLQVPASHRRGLCTMRAMIEIEWLDGRVTKVPELAQGDAFGESVQAELDFGFDDVSEGLWVEVRHHEPDEDSDGDLRGRGCALCADCRYSLVEPSDLDRVFCILYEGQPRVCRVAGELGSPCRPCMRLLCRDWG